MATTLTTDVSKFMLAGIDKFFADNWESWPAEYSAWTKVRGQDKLVGLLQTVGNLAMAEEMNENNPVNFATLEQAYQVSLTLKQIGQGLSFSLQAAKGDLYNMISEGRMKELLRALKTKMEAISIKPWDDAFDGTQIDGIAMCSTVKPCYDVPTTYVTKTTGALDTAGTGAANVINAVKYMAQQKNAQGDPFVAIPRVLKTHAANQVSVEALFGSSLVPFSTAATQTQNSIPKLRGVYSHYLAGTDNWFVEDDSVDHVVSGFLNSMPTPMIETENDFNTKAVKGTAVYMWGAVSLPNPGIVGSSGA